MQKLNDSRALRTADKVYERAREDIVRGAHTPGTRLREEMLAERYKVSRTPVRAAIARLASEGFVEVGPHTGAVVAQRTPDEVAQIFDVRSLLESAAAGLAAIHRSDRDVAALRSIAAAMDEEMAGDQSVERLSSLNKDFHDVILGASGNLTLAQSAERLMALGFLIHTYANFNPEDVRRSLADHRNLILAIETRDEAWAAAVMRSHILGARNRLQARSARTVSPSADAPAKRGRRR